MKSSLTTLSGVALALAMVLTPLPAAAADRYEVYLFTMGPGDDLYQRAGHAALEVLRIDDVGKRHSLVYNYGDADWKDPELVSKFFRGTLKFRLALAGDREQVLAVYGRTQDRSVWSQKLALSAKQARRLAARLAREVKPDKRDYPYHHIQRICTTRIRDLLDEIFAGALSRQLSARHPLTIRDYQPRGFRGLHGAFLAGDILVGRLHDRPMTDYYALYIPDLLREYLQRVKVPDPSGALGKTVPLAGKPEQLYGRWKPPAVTQEAGQTTLVVFGTLSALLLLLGALGIWRAPRGSRLAGAALLLWALPAGLLGLAFVALLVLSQVPELRQNELLALFWPPDLLLVGVALRWLRGRPTAGRLLCGYALLHVSALLCVIVLQLIGVFYQRPLILPVFGGIGTLVLLLTCWRMRRGVSVATT